jgi:site-specific recombinase XerD
MHEAIFVATESHNVQPGRGTIRRSLPLDHWPDADRKAWNAACQPPARLKRGGVAGHLKPVTRGNHARHYGAFLGFLDRSALLRYDGPAAANVTADNVNAYLAEIKGRVSSVTVHGSICMLRRAAHYIAPGCDFTWLSEIGKDLALVAVPRSKFDRLVLVEVLVEAGLTLMHETELSRKMAKLAQAFQFRNGLMVSLLALCPIRRKNFAALEIGRSFVKIQGTWWIVLSASETKERRADERPVDELLTPLIDRYLGQYRPVLARSANPPPVLWLSANDGVPIAAEQVAHAIRMTTLSTVGVAVSPHMFRTAAASSAAIYAGNNPYLGSALLHHTDPRVTNDHYNRATSLRAAESFRQIVRQYEKTSP